MELGIVAQKGNQRATSLAERVAGALGYIGRAHV
jgi:hypothetical protein